MNGRIIHGDALDELRRMENDSFACCLTSPPYNYGDRNPPGKAGPGGVQGKGRLRGGYGDDPDLLSRDEYIDFHRSVIQVLLRLVQSDGLIWWVHRRRPNAFPDGSLSLPDAVLEGFPVRSEIIWDKGGPGVGFCAAGRQGGAFFPTPAYETIFLLAQSKEALLVREPAARGDIWRIPRERNPHPASFPLELALRALRTTAAQGAVIDPFAGSGTTARACRMVGREFTLIEKNAEYLPMIKNVINEQTQTSMLK